MTISLSKLEESEKEAGEPSIAPSLSELGELEGEIGELFEIALTASLLESNDYALDNKGIAPQMENGSFSKTKMQKRRENAALSKAASNPQRKKSETSKKKKGEKLVLKWALFARFREGRKELCCERKSCLTRRWCYYRIGC